MRSSIRSLPFSLPALSLCLGAALSGAASAQSISLSAPASNQLQHGNSVTVAYSISEPSGVQSEQVTFTCSGGYCASIGSPTVVLAMKTTAAGNTSISFDPTNLAASSAVFTSASAKLPDGTYLVQAQYVRAANGATVMSVANSGVGIDMTTLAPQLAAPASGSASRSPLTVSIAFPEAYAPGTASLQFASESDAGPNLTYTLADDIPIAGFGGTPTAFSFNVPTATMSSPYLVASNPAGPSDGGADAGAPGLASLPDGLYNVTFSYQDVYLHAAATALSTGVIIDTVTESPLLGAPQSGQSYALPLQISFEVPEDPLANSCSLTFVPASDAGPFALLLPCSYGNGEPQVVTLPESDDAELVGNFSSVVFSYQDYLGNNAATAVATAVTVLEPELAIVGAHAHDFAPGDASDEYTLTVSNDGSETFATVTVVDTLPAGLSALLIAGDGWSCTLATLTCTRSDVLDHGASYPAITILVSTSAQAVPSVVNHATVSGGGGLGGSASDATTVDCASGLYLADGGTNCVQCSSACAAGTFELSACTATADRSCTNCTAIEHCTAESCTSSTDQSCSGCGSGYFAQGGACTACSAPCAPGSYQSAACSAAADRVCSGCDSSCATCSGSATKCTSCRAGSFLDGGVCTACAACAPGTFQSTACSATADTVCLDCSPGTYSAASDSLVCLRCAPGTFSASQRSTACAACAPGTSALEGQNVCSPCSGATVSGVEPSGACIACDAGSYPNGDNSGCLPCMPGSAAEAGSLACTACDPGFFSSVQGAANCIACDVGEFAASSGATACQACPPGSFADQTGSISCTACPNGEFLDGGSCQSCSPPCADGQFESAACSDTSDRVCSQCDSNCATCSGGARSCTSCGVGSFLRDGACAACTVCGPGQFQAAACSATSDAICAACAQGTSSDQVGATACLECTPGTFSANTGATECAACPAGTSSGTGQNACSPCAPGSVAPSALSSACMKCEAGSYPNGDNTACLTCAAGSFSQPGDTACTACAAGKFSPAGSGVCAPCDVGQFSSSPGSSSCAPCPPGTSAGATGSSSCAPCAAGSYAASSGAPSCALCGDCDDANECTTDSCDAVLGCTHTAIPHCSSGSDAGTADGGDAGTADGGTSTARGGCSSSGEDGRAAALLLLALGLVLRSRRRTATAS